jgi:CPA2 family monovalent cation:H+ antiporter-2
MASETDLILTLAGALSSALVLGLLARRMGLSPIVGYLVAGIVVGPYTPGIVVDHDIAEQLAELGIVVMMFGVGLHFRVRDLIATRAVALPGAIAQVAAATALGAAMAIAGGWTVGPAVLFGIAISVASTVLLTRVLADHDALHTPVGQVAVGWLLVEDLFIVLVLVVLPMLADGEDRGPGAVALALGGAALKIALLVAFTALAARRAIPALLGWVAKMQSRELFTLTVLVLALGIAVGSAFIFGGSMALGAFLAGVVVAQWDVSARAASEALPMRDAFAVLFFVSVGMLFDPRALLPNLPLTIAAVAVVVVAKPLVAYVLGRLLRRPRAVALRIAVALGQIGEFSFVVAAVGEDLGLLPPEALQIVVATAVVSIALNPVAYRVLAARNPIPEGTDAAHHRVIVVGYDAVGRELTRLLQRNRIDPTLVDMNLQIVRALQRDGVRAVHGDASQREVLERAGVATAASVLIAASGRRGNEVLRAARALSADVIRRGAGGRRAAGGRRRAGGRGRARGRRAHAPRGRGGAARSPPRCEHGRAGAERVTRGAGGHPAVPRSRGSGSVDGGADERHFARAAGSAVRSRCSASRTSSSAAWLMRKTPRGRSSSTITTMTVETESASATMGSVARTPVTPAP